MSPLPSWEPVTLLLTSQLLCCIVIQLLRFSCISGEPCIPPLSMLWVLQRIGSRHAKRRSGFQTLRFNHPASFWCSALLCSRCQPQLHCRKLGLNSLPVAFGPEVAKWITVGTIDVTQIAVAAYLALGRHENVYAAVLTGLILPQVSPLLF